MGSIEQYSRKCQEMVQKKKEKTVGFHTQIILKNLIYTVKKNILLPCRLLGAFDIRMCIGNIQEDVVSSIFPNIWPLNAFSRIYLLTFSAMVFDGTFVKCRSNQNSIFTDEENNGQTSAKGHKATDRWHSLNKKPGSWLPVQCSLKLHCNDTERIFVRCLLVISWSQGKEILTQKFKTFIYNLEVVQNQVRFWL